MKFTAQQIADLFEGEVQGDPNATVSDLSRIEEGTEGTLTFLGNKKYTPYIYTTGATVVLVDKDFVPEQPVKATMVKVDNAYATLAKILQLVESYRTKKTGISPLAFIADTAYIDENAYVAPFAYIGEHTKIGKNAQIHPHVFIDDNVRIGNDCKLASGAKIHRDTWIGDHCTVQTNAIVGSDGFGFSPMPDGSYEKIPQLGNVVIDDNVEIQAGAVIDRASIGSTHICKGVKIDNLVQIAHNVEIGENTVMASQSGVAGSTKIGKQCVVAGQVGIAGHLHIADHCIFGAQAGVPNSIKQSGAYQGTPALPVSTFRRSSVVYKNLSELQKMVYDLQKKVNELSK